MDCLRMKEPFCLQYEYGRAGRGVAATGLTGRRVRLGRGLDNCQDGVHLRLFDADQQSGVAAAEEAAGRIDAGDPMARGQQGTDNDVGIFVLDDGKDEVHGVGSSLGARTWLGVFRLDRRLSGQVQETPERLDKYSRTADQDLQRHKGG